MSELSKKLVSGALTASTALWASGALMIVPVAHGQTVADLQAQISGLLAQIQQLTAQLNSLGGSTTPTPMISAFTRDLTIGSTGADVKALQEFLNSQGYTVAQTGAGSPGNESEYFGTRTQAALAKFQAANSISPAAGYFGPITRSVVNPMLGSVTPTPGPTTPPTPGTPPPVAGTGLTVSLASTNPTAGSLISGSTAAARIPVFAVALTAGTGSAINVNELKFKKNGVLSDTAVSGAYVLQNGKVIAQYTSLSTGVITFSGLGLSIPAGQSVVLEFAIDPASGLSAGNTVSFSMNAATDITATDALNNAVTPTGAFPLNGNIFTVTTVSNPSLATLSVASSAIGTNVTAGTTNNLVGAWNFTGGNSKLWLKGITFKVIGSANKTDLKNIKLVINGAQAGSLLPQVSSNGDAHFDLMASPATLNTGSNNVQVYSDVLGSPSFNFQFEILNAYDILAVDSQYNVPIPGGSNTGTQVSISAGTVTITQATDTPTGSVAKGQSGVALAKVNLFAGGESVRVKFLDFKLTFTGTTSTLPNAIKNINLTDDAGNQVGSTINTPPTSNTCTGLAAAAGYNAGGTVYNDCFGTSGSPINYVVPANTTRVLTLRGDIQSTATFTTIVAALSGNTSNVQGLTSSQNASTGAVSGSALTLASTSLTTAKNSAIGTQSVTPSANSKLIGSYAFNAASAEGVTVSSISITLSAAGNQFQNLKIMIGSTQFGTTQAVLAASGVYSFSGTQFTVPQGQSTNVDVYADVLSSATAGTKAILTTLSGCAASGAVSLTAISCSSTPGQDVVVAGQATIQIALDSASPATNQLVMNSSGNELARFLLTETSNIEDVKITDLTVFQQVAATSTVKSAFNSLKLYKSTNLSDAIATAGNANTAASSSNPGSGYYYKFTFSSPIVVPQANSVTLVLKGAVNTYASSQASDNTTHVFKISTSTDSDNDTLAETVVALGATSNATSAVSLSSPNANTMTVLRSKLTITPTALGDSTLRGKGTNDDLATIRFAADNAGSVVINTVVITFSGTAPSAAAFLDQITLRDPNGNSVGTGNTTSSACNGSNTCTKTFKAIAYTVSGGGTADFVLRIGNSTPPNTLTGASGISQTLSATINAATDVSYTDGIDGAATANINLPSNNTVPISIRSVSYAQGT